MFGRVQPAFARFGAQVVHQFDAPRQRRFEYQAFDPRVGVKTPLALIFMILRAQQITVREDDALGAIQQKGGIG